MRVSVNLPALTSANCMKHLDESLVPSCARDVDAATTDSNGNNTDASIMSEVKNRQVGLYSLLCPVHLS